MQNLKSLSLFLVLAAIFISLGHCRVLQPNDAKFVVAICKQTPYPSNCLQFLQPDPRSSTADVRGLAFIMADVIKAKANDAINKINQLLTRSTGEKKLLKSCLDGYKTIFGSNFKEIKEALQFGNPKFAEDGAADSSAEATFCEDSFSGKSPLTNENNGMHVAAEVARSIIRQLL